MRRCLLPGAAAARSARAPAGSRRQAGLTLIEMVVTIAIIAIAVVGHRLRLLGHCQQRRRCPGAGNPQRGGGIVSEYLQSDTDVPYVACATSYRASPPPQFASNYPRVMVDGSAWPASFAVDLSDPAPGPGYSSLGHCSADYGVQEITITVSDGTTSVERTVWKGAQT